MRTDLNMRKGKMIAQGAHASLKATLENLEHPCVKEWLSEAFTKICVGVNTVEELVALVATADSKNIIASVILDAGRTEFAGVPTITCAAIGPAPEEEIDKITGHLKLL